ncbi:alpha/beta hydrolase family protein [Paraliomyxa miuraensis]|uniref:alpha/beta hydrolase family protein n=1 Tax=Paraliomyxa miuraensis TaxID=376150 RepID=UPI00224D12DD|nr:alpha/beta hydrolase family protein [Paraliomyxa miuraensis]MCX4242945.1 alpha/beta hydrolase family protein [Paraliomyxa miuraensis]
MSDSSSTALDPVLDADVEVTDVVANDAGPMRMLPQMLGGLATTGRRRRRLASWLGQRSDDVLRRVLRGLYLRSGIPYMSPAELERAFAMLRVYMDPAVLAEPDRMLAPPARLPDVRACWRRPVRGGLHSHLVFDTPYEPIHRLYAAEYRRYDRLDTVHLFSWTHARPAPASILVTHGWGVGRKQIHQWELGLDYLFRELGLDVYYYVMPFHWLRRPSAARFSGELHPSPNLMRTNEAFVQKTIELRAALRWIKARSSGPLGMMGSSLGGYTTALLASLEDSLDFAIPVLPPASLSDLFWDAGQGDPVLRKVSDMGMTRERFAAAWALHCPLTYRPKVPWRGRLVVGAAGDNLVTPEHTDVLWEHWGRPRRFEFAGGHILQVFRTDYHREVGRFLAELGVISGERIEPSRGPLAPRFG